MTEAGIELLVALRKYIEESEKRIENMSTQIKLLTSHVNLLNSIDEAILEVKNDRRHF